MGEILVEIMRRDVDTAHSVNGVYMGPYPSGAPAIFIDAVANLRASTSFIGVIGCDDFGKLPLRHLGRDGVDIKRIRVAKGYTTGTAFVMYHSSGARRFVFYLRHSAGQLSPDDVEADLISKRKILHVMGSSLAVSKSSGKACYKAAEIARDSNGIITFDPNLRPELLGIETIRKICKPLIKASRAILPSREEATTLTGSRDPAAAAGKLIGQGPEIAVIRMGAGGALGVKRGNCSRAILRSLRAQRLIQPVLAMYTMPLFCSAFSRVGLWLRSWSMQVQREQ